MPAHYVIDFENRIVMITFRGMVTLREAVEQSARLKADPTFDPEFSELIDFNSASDVQLNYVDFKSLWDADPFSANSKRAFVIESRDAVYGTARMYQIMRGDEARVGVFSTLEEAVRWLMTPVESAS